MRYKVGDRVRIVDQWVWIGQNTEGRMDKWLGKAMTISVVGNGSYHMLEDYGENMGDGWFWDEDMIAGPASYPTIVLTSDGKTATATMQEGKQVIKRAEAVCSPADTYDYDTGVKLAFERLMVPDVTPMEPEYYSGKVVCVEKQGGRSCASDFTVGKVYTFKNGRVTDDVGFRLLLCSPDLRAAKKILGVTFIPFVEA